MRKHPRTSPPQTELPQHYSKRPKLSDTKNSLNNDNTVKDNDTDNNNVNKLSELYPEIRTVQQRVEYRREFDDKFPEYNQLGLSLEQSTRKLAKYKDKLDSFLGSEKMSKIKQKLSKTLTRHAKNKLKFLELHEMLGFINKRIEAFDALLAQQQSQDMEIN